MFSLDKFHSKRGLFGGGGGGDGGAGATAAIQQGTTQGNAALEKYYQQGVQAITTGAQQAQGYLGSYGTAGGTALDALYDTLGLARPEAGSNALTSALQNQDALMAAHNAATGTPASTTTTTSAAMSNLLRANDFQGDPAAWHPNSSFSGGVSYYQTPIMKTADGTAFFDASTGKLAVMAADGKHFEDADPATYGLTVKQNPYDKFGQYRLQQGSTTTTTPATAAGTPMTAQQQAQYDLLQGYKNGNVQMTDPASKQGGVLAQLQQTPGYQFMMQQGLQGVDRSAAAQGLLGSGAAIKAATNYAGGQAQKTYNDRVSQLMQAAGLGAQAAGSEASNASAQGTSLATLGSNMGANTASLYGGQSAGLAQVAAGQAAANASSSNGLFSLIGAGLSAFSDRRLKKDIKQIDTHTNGLPIYTFKYVWDADTTHTGFMADDVEKVHPEAISYQDGFARVNYSIAVK